MLSTADVVHLVIALALLVLAAHAVGFLFARFRQPAVIGEIVGGLLLGPTVLGALAPRVTAALFPTSGPVAVGIAAVNQIGLLLLMFLAGAELRVRAARRERRTAGLVTVAGLVVPFCVGALVVAVAGYRNYAGPHGSALSLTLVFGIAAAVAAIPIIARIMMDLGIITTPLGRIVMLVAIAEDAALYVMLAVVLGLADAESHDAYGLWSAVGTPAVLPTAVYHTAASLLFLGTAAVFGPRFFRWLASARWNIVNRANPTAFRLVFLLLSVACCAGLGVTPIFGALLAGLSAVRGDSLERDTTATRAAWDAIRRFSLAFFVPAYFALVGLQLDLAHQFDPLFFLWFTVLVCVVKGLSAWLAAVLSGEDRSTAVLLAVALNARGTPGVLLATVTYGAGVINVRFFTALVLMSIVTCEIAGFWLERAFGHGERPGPRVTAESKETL
jgi:Kef-type K+ transport system membrane component KefB